MNLKSLYASAFVLMSVVSLTACDSADAGGPAGNTPLAGGCQSDDPSQVCLALNYVTYSDDKGQPVASEDTAVKNLGIVNEIFKPCGIQFQIDNYQVVEPTQFGLTKNDSMGELNEIRKTFDDGRTLLIAQTGFWGTTKNAWTAMPGSDAYGAVFESTVADYGNIVAHELGHYLNLDHVDEKNDVMSTVIYPESKDLTEAQCTEMRATVESHWAAMKR